MLRRAGAGSTARPGFTLVELMIVIAIIAVLAALTTAGVGRVREMGRRTQAMNDISQLSTAASAFKNKYGFLPPSTFTAPTQVNRADTNYILLTRMFRAWPAANRDTLADGTTLASLPGYQAITFRTVNIGGIQLDGNQTMAFFLGGPNQQGFAPQGPYTPTGNTKVQPFFDFQEARFVTGPNGVPWYSDPWGNPYAFFSCGSGDSYATMMSATVPLQFPLTAAAGGPGTLTNSKGVNTNTFVTPYRSGSRWVNPGGVQIISAGSNGSARSSPMGFGPGSIVFSGTSTSNVEWTPGVGQWGPEMPGEDDLANFNNGAQLGSSGQ
jgi:prepilin-type N-terminal cleavage/methylation domain-containing protein